MTKYYTEHKLTDHQLRFLSQVVNGRVRSHFRPTWEALRKRGLVYQHYTYGDWLATDRGKAALSQARREGW